jgi:hypothetical protein
MRGEGFTLGTDSFSPLPHPFNIKQFLNNSCLEIVLYKASASGVKRATCMAIAD